MHEWALAEGVVETARRVASERGLRSITSIRVRMGALQQIDDDIFREAIAKFQSESDEVRNAEVIFEQEPIRAECRRCETSWEVAGDELEALGEEASEAIHFVPELARAYLRCPECGSADFAVERGRGVWIESVEGVGNED